MPDIPLPNDPAAMPRLIIGLSMTYNIKYTKLKKDAIGWSSGGPRGLRLQDIP
jgi:hypothetical protein